MAKKAKKKFSKDEEMDKDSRPQGKGGRADKKFCNWQQSRDNDPRWYSLNDQLLFDSANIPYSWPLGAQINLGEYGSDLNNTAVPGVMAIYTMPAIGNPQDPNAPVNTAARNIYSYIRHANSGGTNDIESPDMMLYLLAMDSAYSFHSWMKRLYGVMQTYNPENRYFPRGIVQAMGVDFDDIQRNLADFRMYINVFANKIGSMCIPASMSYMAKHIWMYEGLYFDSVSSKAQTYMFNPYGFLYYDQYNAQGTGDQTRGVLKLMPMTGRKNLLTREDIYEIGNALINPILASQDINIMSGDILKAFGPENMFKIDYVPEDYIVLPSYSMEVLDQIQNMTMVGDVVAPANNNIAPMYCNQMGTVIVDQVNALNTGYLVNSMKFCLNDEWQGSTVRPTGFNYLASNKFVTFQYDNITTANTMEATRMTNTIEVPDAITWVGMCQYSDTNVEFGQTSSTSDKDTYMQIGDRWVYDCNTMGSEVACFARIYMYRVNNQGQFALMNTEKFYTTHCLPLISTIGTSGTITLDVKTPTATTNSYGRDAAQNFTNYNLLLTALSQFDRHPALVPVLGIYKGTLVADTNVPRAASLSQDTTVTARSLMNGLCLDLDKYAIVDKHTLANMTATALLSEFNVRQFGRATDTKIIR